MLVLNGCFHCLLDYFGVFNGRNAGRKIWAFCWYCACVGEQAQLVTSNLSWMEGRMLYQLPPGSPSIPRPYKSRYTCTQQIRHQHRQVRGRRRTGSEHQHRQVRGDLTGRPVSSPPGPDWRGWIVFLMVRPIRAAAVRFPRHPP